MNGPLQNLEEWDDCVASRYDPEKSEAEFRDYENTTPAVREFYRLNHIHQTRDFVLEKKREYLAKRKASMGVWEAIEYLNTLVDDSDPDTDLSQIQHNLQTAEAIRRDGHPDWFVLTGLMHDLGKVLCLYGEPQWAVVGDTFPVGCAYSDKVVFNEFFKGNPDSQKLAYQSKLGIYEEGCGLDKVDMSWGHDEYLYHLTKEFLPESAQYMIRYHSCYPIHREGGYDFLLNAKDREMLGWVRKFNPYDLYSKSAAKPDEKALRPYYQDLIAKYFPAKLDF